MAKYGFKGWIKLWRVEMRDNPFYDAEPFDKWHAWMDLKMLADENETVRTSLEALKTRWLWSSRMKVSRFLVTLNETGCVTVTSIKNKGTLIRINTRFPNKSNEVKNTTCETVSDTVSVNEEVYKEVGKASLRVSLPNKKKKEREIEIEEEKEKEEMKRLMEELGDEYE